MAEGQITSGKIQWLPMKNSLKLNLYPKPLGASDSS